MSEPVLKVEGLRKHYGALTVTDDVSLDVRAGELHALIGPNGAGKTTLVGQIGGQLHSDAGRIWFDGRDITALPAASRAKTGLSRSFQISSVFGSFTARGNAAIAVQGHERHSFRFWQPADRARELHEPAGELLEKVALRGRDNVPAPVMSHGERRLLELAMALAGEPKLLLLDEPMAGLGREESNRMVEFLLTLKGRYAILLIEHDMDAVFALADRISVLAAGRIIATGTPDEIRADAAVRAAYLGEEDAEGWEAH